MSNKKNRPTIKIIALAVIMASAAASWLLLSSGGQQANATTASALPPPKVFTLDQAMQGPAVDFDFQTGMEHLPNSLKGVEPPNGLIIDEAGNLVVTHTLREFYDYFLSALGEESLATLRARTTAYMTKSLPPRANDQAQAIFDSYLNYRQALMNVPKAGGKPADQLDLEAVSAQKNAEQALRSQFLSPNVIAAFFGDEDAYDRYTFARLRLEADKTLSDPEKQAREQALFAQLPVETQTSLKTARKLQDLDQINADCQKQNCSPEQLHRLRADAVGAEAADRLQTLDNERAAWKSRVDSFLDQRAAILASQSFSNSDKQAQLQQLRAGFSPQEQLRLAAFEQLHDQKITSR